MPHSVKFVVRRRGLFSDLRIASCSMGSYFSRTGAGGLLDVVLSGDAARLRTLARAGAEVNAVFQEGWTLLHKACWHGQAACVLALLEMGAIKDAANVYGWTPLHTACWRGHEACAVALINARANIEALNMFSCTPL
ncbi:ankyrin repeat domain-containing protein, partial [archaeon]